ncbi:MAG: hypothetical protein D6698_05030 [Gammaproteobacteria bacterium]|nr:MAG: hypothetical protein D6698_05030 [Gammaproteobacteria bacterium]
MEIGELSLIHAALDTVVSYSKVFREVGRGFVVMKPHQPIITKLVNDRRSLQVDIVGPEWESDTLVKLATGDLQFLGRIIGAGGILQDVEMVSDLVSVMVFGVGQTEDTTRATIRYKTANPNSDLIIKPKAITPPSKAYVTIPAGIVSESVLPVLSLFPRGANATVEITEHGVHIKDSSGAVDIDLSDCPHDGPVGCRISVNTDMLFRTLKFAEDVDFQFDETMATATFQRDNLEASVHMARLNT